MPSEDPKTPTQAFPAEDVHTTFMGLALLGIDSTYPALTELQSIISPDHFIAAARNSAKKEELPASVQEDEKGTNLDNELEEAEQVDLRQLVHESSEKEPLAEFVYVESKGVGYGQDLSPARLGVRDVRENSDTFSYAIDRFPMIGDSFAIYIKYKVDSWAHKSDRQGALSFSPLFGDWCKPRSFLIEATSAGPRVQLRRNVPVWESSTPDDKRDLVVLGPREEDPATMPLFDWHTLVFRYTKPLGVATLWHDGKLFAEERAVKIEGSIPNIQRTNHPEYFVGFEQDSDRRLAGYIETIKVVKGGHSEEDIEAFHGTTNQDVASPISNKNEKPLAIATKSPSRDRSTPSKPTTLFDIGKGNAFENVAGVPVRDEELRLLFETYDTDNSGTISRDEFKKEFMNFESFGVAMSEKQVNNMFDKYDTRKDGRLDYGEFALLMLQRARM